MPYTPNNPLVPGDPYSYDLKWMVEQIRAWKDPMESAAEAKASAEEAADQANAAKNSALNAANSASDAEQTANDLESVLDNYSDYFNEALNDQGAEISLLQSRVSSFEQLAEGSTTGDAELIDGRIAYDGVTYPTIGDAIRGQAAPLYNDIVRAILLNGTLPETLFEKGGISTGGADSSYNAASRMRTPIIKLPFDLKVTTGTGTQAIVVHENIAGTWKDTGWLLNGVSYIIPAGTEFRIMASLTYTVNTSATIAQIAAAFTYEVLTPQHFLRANYVSANRLNLTISDAVKYKRLIALPGYELTSSHDGYTEPWSKALDISSYLAISYINIRKADNSSIAVWEGSNAIIGEEYAPDDPIYVKTNGSDSNTGSAAAPLASISEALKRGRNNIYVAPGIYNETVTAYNRAKVSIKLWSDTRAFSEIAREKITVINGTILTTTAIGTPNVYTAPYTYTPGDDFDLVFISQANPPTTPGSISLEYNALLCCFAENETKRPLLTPVLTSQDMLDNDHSFYYDGNTIYIHESIPFTMAFVPNDINRVMQFINCDDVYIENVNAIGAKANVMQFNYCTRAELYNCVTGFSAKANGWAVYNTDITFNNCKSYAISADGYNFHRYGSSQLINCSAAFCGDDGCSHHEGCEGVIIAGEFCYCTSGGITPSFGSIVNIYNAYCHNNARGLQYLGDAGYSRRTVLANGILAVNNTIDIYADQRYDIIFANGTYGTKSIGSGASFTEY